MKCILQYNQFVLSILLLMFAFISQHFFSTIKLFVVENKRISTSLLKLLTSPKCAWWTIFSLANKKCARKCINFKNRFEKYLRLNKRKVFEKANICRLQTASQCSSLYFQHTVSDLIISAWGHSCFIKDVCSWLCNTSVLLCVCIFYRHFFIFIFFLFFFFCVQIDKLKNKLNRQNKSKLIIHTCRKFNVAHNKWYLKINEKLLNHQSRNLNCMFWFGFYFRILNVFQFWLTPQ